MKLKGKMFKYPKEVNEITIKNGKGIIHTHDNGNGYIYAVKVDDDEEMSFTLNKRDFKQLSKFEEFSVKMKNETIKIQYGSVKLTLANLIEHEISNPNFSDLEDVNIEYEELFIAKNFIGTSDTHIQVLGTTIHKDCVTSSNEVVFYKKEINTGVSLSINIPKETFRNVPFIEGIKIQSNGKLARFFFEGVYYYTSLISVCLPGEAANRFVDATEIVKIDIKSVKALLEKLNLIKTYDDYVDFNFDKNKLMLSGISEIEKVEINDLEDKVNENYEGRYTYNIEHLKTLLSVIKDDKVTIKIMEKGILLLDIKEMCMLLPYTRTNMTEKEKK